MVEDKEVEVDINNLDHGYQYRILAENSSEEEFIDAFYVLINSYGRPGVKLQNEECGCNHQGNQYIQFNLGSVPKIGNSCPV